MGIISLKGPVLTWMEIVQDMCRGERGWNLGSSECVVALR